MVGVRLSSYGCTREVGRAREKRFDWLNAITQFHRRTGAACVYGDLDARSHHKKSARKIASYVLTCVCTTLLLYKNVRLKKCPKFKNLLEGEERQRTSRGRLHEPGLTGNPGSYINPGYRKFTFTWSRVACYLKPIHLTRVRCYAARRIHSMLACSWFFL